MTAISVRRDSYASVAGGADAAIPGWRDIYKPFSALMDSHRSLGLSTIGRIVIFRDALQESHICCSSLTGFVRERMPEGSSPRNAAYIVSGMIRGRYLIHDNDLHSVRASSELHDLIRDISSLLDGFCAIGDSRERMLRVDAGRKRHSGDYLGEAVDHKLPFKDVLILSACYALDVVTGTRIKLLYFNGMKRPRGAARERRLDTFERFMDRLTSEGYLIKLQQNSGPQDTWGLTDKAKCLVREARDYFSLPGKLDSQLSDAPSSGND